MPPVGAAGCVWMGLTGGSAAPLGDCQAPVIINGLECVAPLNAGVFLVGTLDHASLSNDALAAAQQQAARNGHRLVHEAGGLYRMTTF